MNAGAASNKPRRSWRKHAFGASRRWAAPTRAFSPPARMLRRRKAQRPTILIRPPPWCLLVAMALDTKIVKIGSAADVQPRLFSPRRSASGVSQGPGGHREARRRRRDARRGDRQGQGRGRKRYGVAAGVGPEIPVKFTGVVGEGKSGIYNVAVTGSPNDPHPRADRSCHQRHRAARRYGRNHLRPVQEPDRLPERGDALNDELKKKVLAKIDTAAHRQDDHGHRSVHPGESHRLARNAFGWKSNESTTEHFDEVVLEARNIVKTYGGTRALKGVNFQIRKGTVTTLFGENGAGKSTLMKILSGVEQPTTGEIILDGEPVVFARPPMRESVGSRSSIKN